MISTFQALAVAVLAVVPGTSYLFAYERVFGAFGIGLGDRIFRFLAASSVFGAVFSGPGLLFYRSYVASGALSTGHVNWLLFELYGLAYVGIPTAVGSAFGYGHMRRWTWLTLLLGDSHEPRAWDHVWRRGDDAMVRVKLKSGSWVAGVFGLSENSVRSYASGYPESGDLFLSSVLAIDADTGEYKSADQGPPERVDGGGLLLKWAEVEYLEIQYI